MNFFGWIGQRCVTSICYICDLTYFITTTLSVWRPHRNVFNPAVYYSIVKLLVIFGVNALSTVSFLAILIGIGVTSQLIYIMAAITGAGDITAILARLVLSEMGPLMTGFVLVGRSCTAIVVDIGYTKVQGEIEPLDYSGINILDYLVIPKVIAMTISQVSLAFYFTAIMIVCGVFFSAYIYHFSAQESLAELLGAITFTGVIRFTIKNLFFGLVIAAIACFHGLAVKNSPTEVSEQMQKAVVRCLIFLLLADGYFITFTL